MKVSMNHFLKFSVFFCFWSSIHCSQLTVDLVEGEKQAQSMMLSSAQSIRQLDALLKQKQEEKNGHMQAMEWNQLIVNHSIYAYDQARDQNIPIMPCNVIVSQWNNLAPHDLSPLVTISRIDIDSLESKIALLQGMSPIDQWKYFHENTKNSEIHNPSQLIDFLQGKLAEKKQILQDSVHASRSQQLAQSFLGVCVCQKNYMDQQRKILEQLDKEEEVLVQARKDYQLINDELKDLWYGDEQAARTDLFAQFIKKLYIHKQFLDKHKLLLGSVNKEIIVSGQAKQTRAQQIKKDDKKKRIAEQKLMSLEDALAINIQCIEKQQIVAAEEEIVRQAQVEESQSLESIQKEVTVGQQELEAIVVEAAKKRNRHKKFRLKQKKSLLDYNQEQCHELLELQNEALDIDQAMQLIQNQADEALRSQVEMLKVDQIKIAENEVVQTAIEPAAIISSDIAYQNFLVNVQNNTIDSSENHVAAIQTILRNYADIACDENVTDEAVLKMQNILNILFDLNQHLLEIDQRMSWHVALDSELCKKMNDRFKILFDTYESGDQNFELLKSSVAKNCGLLEMEIAELDRSFAQYRNIEIKSDADKALGRNILLRRVNKKNEIERLYSEYNKMVLYNIMRLAQCSIGILNTDRLLSTEDSSTWKDGNFTEDFMKGKIKNLESKLHKVQVMAKNKKMSELECVLPYKVNIERWCKDIFNHVGLSSDDRDFMSYEISNNIRDLSFKYKQGYLDEDNLEYSLRKNFVDYCKSVGSNYTPLQINDVVNVQITLIVYLSFVLSE